MAGAIIQKFLEHHALLPELQVSRACSSLRNTLQWRRYCAPHSLPTRARSVLPELNLVHVTTVKESYVLWVNIDEKFMNRSAPLCDDLSTPKGIADLGTGVLEILATFLEFSCIVDFTLPTIPNRRARNPSYRDIVGSGFTKLVSLIHHHYPRLFDKVLNIHHSDEYLSRLDIPEYLQRETLLLSKPEELVLHLGPEIPPQYGGRGPSLASSDLLKEKKQETDLPIQEHQDVQAPKSEPITLQEEESTASSHEDIHQTPEEDASLKLVFSETIGPPTIILDPEELAVAKNLCPDKMGARLVRADEDMVVKFGYGVRLAEAEALHFISQRTTISAPKLLSAYILDGTTYIIMSYEEGEHLSHYWDRASEAEQKKVIGQLRDYVKQMHDIKGAFIGGIDHSSCRDGIFEGGFGDYQKYSYGPYESEESFNEGIVQALKDRLRPEYLNGTTDPTSKFYNAEFILYQTVRGLRGHQIVFTHADLHAGNIIVRSDGEVVILDWGLAGFWPEYWEFYRAMHNPPWNASWDRMVEKFIPPHYIEHSIMEKIFAAVWN